MSNFKERVAKELSDLNQKIARLDTFLHPLAFDLPLQELVRLHRQLDCMKNYSRILQDRVNADFV